MPAHLKVKARYEFWVKRGINVKDERRVSEMSQIGFGKSKIHVYQNVNNYDTDIFSLFQKASISPPIFEVVNGELSRTNELGENKVIYTNPEFFAVLTTVPDN